MIDPLLLFPREQRRRRQRETVLLQPGKRRLSDISI